MNLNNNNMTLEEARNQSDGEWCPIDYEGKGHPHVAVDLDGTEIIFRERPFRGEDKWSNDLFELDEDGCVLSCECVDCIILPKGTIEKILGRKLTWEDDPVELKFEEDEQE